MKINKNILKCIAFLFGLILIFFISSMLFQRNDKLYVYNSLAVSMRTQDIKAEPDNSLDVLYLGDSETYASFSPKHLYSEYGYTSYVCGTAAQKICDTYVILKDAFKTQSPKVIVLETNCLYREIKSEGERNDYVMNVLTDSFPLFTNHSDWKKLVRKMVPKSRQQKRRSQKGFIVRKKVQPYKGGSYMHKTQKKNNIPKDNIVYLKQIANLCEENNASLLLVSTPSATNWNYKKHNGIKDWADRNHIAYIDLNLEKDIGINWEKDTQDGGDHLNLTGAKKVTHYMGNYFQSNYKLTDHRNHDSEKMIP